VLTGLVHYDRLNVPNPVAVGLDVIGTRWLSVMVSLAAIGALTSAMLVMFMSQPRIFWAMARDGLLPQVFAKVHPKFRTPYVTTIVTGIVVAICAATFTISEAGALVSIGTLLAFVLVCGGVAILRRSHPDIPRPFRAPFGMFTPFMGVLVSAVQMVALPGRTWIRLVVWLGIGLTIYFLYGARRSKLGRRA